MSAITFACFVLGALPPPSGPYCNPSYCPVGQTNVGCNPPASAPVDGTICEGLPSKVFQFDMFLFPMLKYEINRLRAAQSTQILAARMPTVTWDAELAELAAINARVCNADYDECMNTANFGYVGQNVYLARRDSKADYVFIQEAFRFWKNGAAIVENEIDSFPPNPSREKMSAYMLFVDKTDKMGCALHEWKEPGAEKYIYKLVCNFSVRPVSGKPVYIRGDIASQCLTGQGDISGICSASEIIEPVPHNL